MADGTLDSNFLVLIDRWPGAPSHNLSIPSDGFTGSTHNVATAAYDIGTKIQVYNETAGIAGFSTFIYLQYISATEAPPTAAAKQVCTPDANTSLYKVTNDPDQALAIPSLPSAVMLSVMTLTRFGWFYCGGVVPEDYVSDLGGNFACVNTIALGSTIIASNLTADAIGYAIAASAATDLIAGYTLSSDTD